MLQQERWSSLPGDIIAKIISHINFPGPSIVTISATTFDVTLLKSVKYNLPEIWNILDNLFTIFTAPSIKNFRIHLNQTFYQEPCVRPILDSWARRLRACNIQHMAIGSVFYCHFGDGVCPTNFFQNSLVSLHLSSLFINDCDWVGSHHIILPNLKDLTLSSVNYRLLECLVSRCPSLEYLAFSPKIESMGINCLMSISSKNLKRLCIILENTKLSVLDDIEFIIDAPMLKYLYFKANSSFSSIMRMFNSISNLESLELNGGVTTKFINSANKTIFPNLTKLTLTVSSSEIFKAIFEQQLMPHYFPNLEVLVLDFCTSYNINWDTKGIFVLVEHVKRLELHMYGVRLDQQTLNLVTWLLRSAPVLEKLAIHGYGPRPNDDSLDKAEFCKTLFKCAEDTSRCQIELFGGYKLD